MLPKVGSSGIGLVTRGGATMNREFPLIFLSASGDEGAIGVAIVKYSLKKKKNNIFFIELGMSPFCVVGYQLSDMAK